MRKIFRLKHDFDYLGKISFLKHQSGAIFLPYDQSGDLSYHMSSGIETDLPQEIRFAFDFRLAQKTDYVINDILITVLSKKMLETFTSIGSFKHNSIPVIMLNHKELEAYHIEEGLGFEDLKERNDDYVALQLLDFTDAFDTNNSIYRMSRAFPDEIGSIHKLVLKEPNNGFPPIFKIEEGLSDVYITEEAKNALEAAGIKGCEFEEVEVSS